MESFVLDEQIDTIISFCISHPHFHSLPSASTSAMTTPNTCRTIVNGATDWTNISVDGLSITSHDSNMSQPLTLLSQVEDQGHSDRHGLGNSEEWPMGPGIPIGPIAMVNGAPIQICSATLP